MGRVVQNRESENGKKREKRHSFALLLCCVGYVGWGDGVGLRHTACNLTSFLSDLTFSLFFPFSFFQKCQLLQIRIVPNTPSSLLLRYFILFYFTNIFLFNWLPLTHRINQIFKLRVFLFSYFFLSYIVLTFLYFYVSLLALLHYLCLLFSFFIITPENLHRYINYCDNLHTYLTDFKFNNVVESYLFNRRL